MINFFKIIFEIITLVLISIIVFFFITFQELFEKLRRRKK